MADNGDSCEIKYLYSNTRGRSGLTAIHCKTTAVIDIRILLICIHDMNDCYIVIVAVLLFVNLCA